MTRMHARVRAGMVAAMLALAACTEPDTDVIARELYGRWQTDAEKYAGRGFVLTADSLTLYQGGGIHVAYPIERIRRTERDDHTAYVVTYRGVVSPLELSLEYRADDDDPHLRFPNQQRVVWKRATTSVTSGGG